MKKIIALLLAAILILAGCNSSSSEEPLQFIFFADGNETEVMQSIIDDFTAETGIEIELVEVPYDDATTKVQTMIQGGETPALIRTSNPLMFMDYAVDLTGIVDPADYYEGAANYIVQNEEVIAMPLDASANAIIYNKDLTDQYGVNVPTSPEDIWTWDEFMVEASKLIGQEGVQYPAVFDFSISRMATMFYEFGGAIFSEDGTEVTLDSPEVIAAVEQFVALTTSGIIDPSVWAGSGDPSALFRTGQYAFHFSGSWMLGQYADLPFEWGVTYMPIGTQRSSYYGGKYVMALEGSGQEEEAKQFMEYLASPEVHDSFNSETLLMSPRIDSNSDYGEFNDEIAIFQDELANTPATQSADWTNTAMPLIEQTLKDGVIKCIANPNDIEAIMTQVDADCQAIVDDELSKQ